MDFSSSLTLMLLALLFEAMLGYPETLDRWIPHPVRGMGTVIAWLEARLNRKSEVFALRRLKGIVALAALLALTFLAAWLLTRLAQALGAWGAFLLLPLLASTLFAQRSLYTHVAAVQDALQGEGVTAGRRAVSHIVGRRTEKLDEAGIARAAIESLAENLSDGITAPAFWTCLFGLPGGALYKAVNTADSMIGHKSARYHAFGYASARLDDLMNYIPSRFTALLLILAAALPSRRQVSSFDARAAWRAMWRDAPHHRSPNAGWPEAAMAGALGLKLGGPRLYGDRLADDHWMGEGKTSATADDIARALTLFRRALLLHFFFYLLLLLAMARLD